MLNIANEKPFSIESRFPHSETGKKVYPENKFYFRWNDSGLILLCDESVNYCPDIDWDYTMTWFPASLLITRRGSSTCVTKMRLRFVYARRRYTAMADMRQGLARCNANNFVVYYQKHKVWVLVL